MIYYPIGNIPIISRLPEEKPMDPMHPGTSSDPLPEWADPEVAAAWRRWHSKHAQQTRPLTDLLVQAAQIRPGLHVLDLASGAGEPALGLAQAVGPEGQVTATDLSEAMLSIIRDAAREQGLTNLRYRQADAAALPFPDQSFDAVTCRLGIMHIPNAARALREALRVLREGGRAAFLVWGPPSEQGMFLHHQILARHVQIPVPAPGEPHPLRFAQPGTLQRRRVRRDSSRYGRRPTTACSPGGARLRRSGNIHVKWQRPCADSWRVCRHRLSPR